MRGGGGYSVTWLLRMAIGNCSLHTGHSPQFVGSFRRVAAPPPLAPAGLPEVLRRSPASDSEEVEAADSSGSEGWGGRYCGGRRRVFLAGASTIKQYLSIWGPVGHRGGYSSVTAPLLEAMHPQGYMRGLRVLRLPIPRHVPLACLTVCYFI